MTSPRANRSSKNVFLFLSEILEEQFQKWSLGVIVSNHLTRGNLSKCTNKTFVNSSENIWEKLRQGAHIVRRAWQNKDCETDFLLILTDRFTFCDERNRVTSETYNLTAVFDMSEKLKREISVATDLIWIKPRQKSWQEDSKISLINDIIRLYTLLLWAAKDPDHNVYQNDFQSWNPEMQKNALFRLYSLLPRQVAYFF